MDLSEELGKLIMQSTHIKEKIKEFINSADILKGELKTVHFKHYYSKLI